MPEQNISSLFGRIFYIASAINIWFSVAFVVSQLGIHFPILVRRRGVQDYIVNITFFTPTLDEMISILSLLSIIFSLLLIFRSMGNRVIVPVFLLLFSFLLRFSDFSVASKTLALLATFLALIVCSKRLKVNGLNLLLTVWLAFLTMIAMISSARFVANSYDGTGMYSDGTWHIPLQLALMSGVFFPILPRIFLIFLAGWVLKMLSLTYQNIMFAFVKKLFRRSFSFSARKERHERTRLFLLITAMLAVAVVCLYPYLPGINPTSRLVGVDVIHIQRYYERLENSLQMPSANLFDALIKSDRTLYLIFQHTIGALLGSASLGIRLIPLVLGLLLVVSVYSLVLVGTKNGFLAGVCALVTAVSFQVVVGINAGFYANWLAIVQLYLFYTFLLKSAETKSAFYGIFTIMVSVAILFTHPATWLVFMGMLPVYLIIGYVRRRAPEGLTRFETGLVIFTIAANVIAYPLRVYLTGYGAGEVLEYSLSGIGINYIPFVVQHLESTFTLFLGGAFANPLLIFISVAGVWSISRCATRFYRAIIALMLTSSLGVFLASSSYLTPEFLQARFIYLIPFGILGGLGLFAVANFLHTISSSQSLGRMIHSLTYLFVFLTLLSHALGVVGVLFPP